jgi:hypothetical protein
MLDDAELKYFPTLIPGTATGCLSKCTQAYEILGEADATNFKLDKVKMNLNFLALIFTLFSCRNRL